MYVFYHQHGETFIITQTKNSLIAVVIILISQLSIIFLLLNQPTASDRPIFSL